MKFTGTILFVSVACLASLVSGVPFIDQDRDDDFEDKNDVALITSPPFSSTYRAGTEMTISWIDPQVETISVILLTKYIFPNRFEKIREIATNVTARDLKYVWQIPLEIDAGRDYQIEFFANGKTDSSAFFVITPGVGSVSN